MKINFTRNFLKYSFLLALLGIATVTYTNQSGPGAGYANAPSEGNCTSCHSGSAVGSGSSWDAITLSGLPTGGYAPSTTYSLTLNGSSAATAKNGFQVVALTSTNAMAGSFTSGTGSQTMISGTRTYIGHTSSGTPQSSFSFNWTAPSSAVGTVTFYMSWNATNSSNNTVGDVVYVKTFTVNAGNLPVATITSPLNAAVFCAGDSIQFTGTATNSPTSYAWDFLGNVPNASTLQNPKIRFNNAGFYTIRFRATNSSGTSTNAQITIQVAAKPAATISGSNIVCGTDSITLSANAGNGLSYLWSPGNQTTKDLKVGAAGTYSVKVTGTGGCFTNSSPFVVTASSKPSLSITTSKDTLCTGDSLEIVATPGMSLYKYYFGSTLMDSSANSTRKFLVNTPFTNLYVLGSNGQCNSNPAFKALSISSKPSAPTITCGPTSPNFVAFQISGTNTQISLDSGKTFQTPNQGSTHIISSLAPNTQILAYARNGVGAPCLYSMSSSKVCASANCTTLSLHVNAPQFICYDDPNANRMIRVTNTSAVNPYFKYEHPPFIGSGGFIKADSFKIVNNINSNINVKVTVIDSANSFCPVKDTSFMVKVIRIAIPSVTLNTLKSGSHCANDLVTFKVNGISSAVNQVKYHKKIGGIFVEVATVSKPQSLDFGPMAVLPNYSNGTQLQARAIDTVTGCWLNSNIYSMVVEAMPNVGFTYVKSNLQIALTDTTSNTVNRRWIIEGDTFPATGKTYTHTFTSAGSKTIRMEAYTSGNCVGTMSVQVNIVASGLLDAANAMGMELYPNPTNNEVNISWAKGGKGNVELFDLSGKLVWQTEIVSGNKLNVSELSKGVYLIKLSTPEQSAFRKLIIE